MRKVMNSMLVGVAVILVGSAQPISVSERGAIFVRAAFHAIFDWR